MSQKCRFCELKTDECYEHCQSQAEGRHRADPTHISHDPRAGFVVDVWCRYCGQSGAVEVDEASIQWE